MNNWTVTTTEPNGNVSTVGYPSRRAAREAVAEARAEGLESTYAPGTPVEFVNDEESSTLGVTVELPVREEGDTGAAGADDAQHATEAAITAALEHGGIIEYEGNAGELQASQHTPTVSIITALDAGMTRIRELNPDVPTALAVIIATGSGKKHGHFEPGSWADTAGEHAGSSRHEILMGSESLSRGAVPTLTTLIHEAAHASAHAQGIKDTSRQGRFHNRKFRDVAESMGLVVEEDNSIGHVTTGLTSQALVDYADVIAILEGALTTHRKPASAKPTKEKTSVKVGCECYDDSDKQLTVTVPIKWYDAQTLFCESCETRLMPV